MMILEMVVHLKPKISLTHYANRESVFCQKNFLQPHCHSAPIFVHYRIASTSIIYLLSDKENEIL